jgi:hypothetical protein
VEDPGPQVPFVLLLGESSCVLAGGGSLRQPDVAAPETSCLHVLDIREKQAICQAASVRTSLHTTTAEVSSLGIKSTPLGGKMRSRINAVVMLAASFIVFIAVGSAKSVQTSGHQFPTAVLMDDPGPMCPPDSGCGPKYGVPASREHLPAVWLAAGPGPMCIPDAPCVYNFGILASRARFRPGVLMADGTGPMCIPHTACGYNHDVVKGRDLAAAILLTDGTGPMCIPGTACMSQMYLPRAV